MTGTHLEPANDPVWESRRHCLLEYLRTPRTWEEMLRCVRGWRWTDTKLRSVLAYCGGSVGFGVRDGEMKWWTISTAVEAAQ